MWVVELRSKIEWPLVRDGKRVTEYIWSVVAEKPNKEAAEVCLAKLVLTLGCTYRIREE